MSSFPAFKYEPNVRFLPSVFFPLAGSSELQHFLFLWWNIFLNGSIPNAEVIFIFDLAFDLLQLFASRSGYCTVLYCIVVKSESTLGCPLLSYCMGENISNVFLMFCLRRCQELFSYCSLCLTLKYVRWLTGFTLQWDTVAWYKSVVGLLWAYCLYQRFVTQVVMHSPMHCKKYHAPLQLSFKE